MKAFNGLERAMAALRTKAGLTQTAVATKAGLAISVVNRAEKGQWLPELPTLDAYLAAVGADAHDLARALVAANGRTTAAGPGVIVDELVARLERPDALETKEALYALAAAQARGVAPEDIEASVAEAARRMTRRVLDVYGELDALGAAKPPDGSV